MRRILVTAVSGDIGNGIMKILKETDCHLFACDVNEIAVGMDLAEEFWQCPFAVDPSYIPSLLETCKRLEITHLIPVNEREIEVISPRLKLFQDAGIKVVIQNADILSICLNKYKTASFLKEQGFDVPESFLNPREIPAGERRYVVKPNQSNGSKGLSVMTGKEIRELTVYPEDMVYQEYIDSDEEYTVGVFCHQKEIRCISFRRELKHGYSNLVELSQDPALQAIGRKAAEVFHMEGYFNVQLRKKGEYYYIFEINPRISGTVRFRHMLGFQDVLWWLDILDGKTPAAYENKYRKALGIRELNEKYLILE